MAELTVPQIRQELRSLAARVKNARRWGDFLLSTNEFSSAWILLTELDRAPVRDSISNLVTAFLGGYLDSCEEPCVVFAPFYTQASERELKMGAIAEDAVHRIKESQVRFCRVDIDRERQTISFHRPRSGQWVGFFAISVHVDLIKKIVGFVRQQGYKVHTVVTLLEREKTSRQELRELGVELIPFIVYDERTDSADSVLDLEAPEYGVCRKYFKNLQGVD